MRNVYVIEVSPAIDDQGTLQTFLFSSEGWATLPTDTPANTLVRARLDQPGNFRRELFSGNKTIGAVRPAFGECSLINTDGALDEFARYGFDGRDFILRYGPSGAAYPSGFTTLIKATLRGATFDMSRVHLIIRDRMELLDRPISSEVFAGTGGAEGTSDLAGKRKPLAFGQIRNMRPTLISQSLLLYSVGKPPSGQVARGIYTTDGQGGLLAYALGQTPPLGAYAETSDELIAASIQPGYYWMCPSSGMIKLGSQPAIDLTTSVSVETSGFSPLYEVGTILSQMAETAGIPTIDSTDVAAVNAVKPAIYGYSVSGDETALSAMAKVASGAFVWFGMGADDVMHMGVLDTPSGTPVITLRSHDITDIQRLDGGDTNRLIPIWRATAQCSHNDAKQTSFSGSAGEQVRSWARVEWPGEVVSADSSIKDKHIYADELSIEVYGGAIQGSPSVDGGAASQAMALYGVERELLQVSMPMRPEVFAALEIGAVVELRFPRYEWATGKLFRTVAIDADFGLGKLKITLWG